MTGPRRAALVSTLFLASTLFGSPKSDDELIRFATTVHIHGVPFDQAQRLTVSPSARQL